MSAFLAVFRRELDEHRLLLRTFAGLGLMPLLLPWLLAPFVNGLSRHPIGDIRVGIAVGGSLGTAVVLVLLLGSGALARPLADGRLGFFFSRPLGTAAIVGGKLVGTYATLLLTVALLWLPTLVVERPVPPEGFWSTLPILLLLLFLALTAVHALTVAALARGPWLLAELVGIGVAGVLVWNAYRQLESRWVEGEAALLAVGATSIGAVLLVLAAAIALGRGRADLVAVHRRQALLAAPLLLAVGAAAAGAADWYLHPKLRDLQSIYWAVATPGAGTTVVGGPARGRSELGAVFTLTPNGHAAFLEVQRGLDTGFAVSPDGRLIAYRRTERLGPRNYRSEVVITDVGSEPGERLSLATTYTESNLAWSADSSVAYGFDGNHLLAIPADPRATPRRLLTLPQGSWDVVVTRTVEGLLSVLHAPPAKGGDVSRQQREAWLVDPTDGTTRRRARFPHLNWPYFQLDPAHRRVLLYDPAGPTADTTLLDLDTGTELFRIPWRVRLGDVIFKPDGGLVVLHETGNLDSRAIPRTDMLALDRPVYAVHLAADGSEVARHHVAHGRARLAATLDDGRLLVVEQPGNVGDDDHWLHLYDPLSGEVAPSGDEPVRLMFGGIHDPVARFMTRRGELAAIDPATGALSILATGLPAAPPT